jgi:hypothetical protein
MQTARAALHVPTRPGVPKIYWALVTLAEAAVGLGNEDGSKRWFEEAKSLQPPPAKWMIESTEAQLANLRQLLTVAAAKGIPLQGPAPPRGRCRLAPTGVERSRRR